MTVETAILCSLVFGVGMCVGILLASSLKGSPVEGINLDTERLNFLEGNRMSLDCSPTGETWCVLEGFPRETRGFGLTVRHAIDKLRLKG